MEDVSSLLLELSASDDLAGFKKVIEVSGVAVDAVVAPWYGRSAGRDRRMGFNLRTPLQIAAVYGSISVLNYILSDLTAVDVNRRSGDDAATALHLAVAGCSPGSIDAIKLLVSANADVDALDTGGNRPADLIPKLIAVNSVVKTLETLVKASPSSPSSPSRVSSPAKETEVKEKKEYPPDLTLPDIKNGIYGTDEFRMYSFKIKPCSRAYSHDWTECPFVHPGENARRRDPRKYLYSCVPCPEFRKGSCRNGDACEYAHGVFECWLHPAQYRTRLCKDETGCNRRVCFFAHKPEELRMVNPSTVSASMISSPRASSLDMATAMLLMQQPSSPTTNRLKSTLSARNLQLDLDLMALEAAAAVAASSPRSSNWPANRGSDYGELLQGLSLKQSPYSSASPSIPALDHSLATAIMNSRASSFAKRSQSFIDRGAVARQSTLAPTSSAVAPPAGFSGWGSPSGKLDWGIEGEELNKLRKSASFGFRNNGAAAPAALDEPDLSWVQSLVKDAPAQAGAPMQYGLESGGTEMLPSWAEEQMVA